MALDLSCSVSSSRWRWRLISLLVIRGLLRVFAGLAVVAALDFSRGLDAAADGLGGLVGDLAGDVLVFHGGGLRR
jgi:hypothetical protein